jgi:8-oxo-dGDP phosphatase
MQWKIHGERPIYSSQWVNVHLIDVELPDGRRFEHHAVRMHPVAAAVIIDEHDRVLLMWRHRFITGTWGWEIPMGIVEDGETPAQTAAREAEEETGWRPGPLTLLISYEPSNGISDSRHHLFRADDATYQSTPIDATESDRIEWIPLSDIQQLIANGELCDGPTLVGLLHVLVFSSGQQQNISHKKAQQ